MAATGVDKRIDHGSKFPGTPTNRSSRSGGRWPKTSNVRTPRALARSEAVVCLYRRPSSAGSNIVERSETTVTVITIIAVVVVVVVVVVVKIWIIYSH
jgi:hypothetical protein